MAGLALCSARTAAAATSAATPATAIAAACAITAACALTLSLRTTLTAMALSPAIAALRTTVTFGPTLIALGRAAITLRAPFAPVLALGTTRRAALLALLRATLSALRLALALWFALSERTRVDALHRLARRRLFRPFAFHHRTEVVRQRQAFKLGAGHLADVLEVGAFVLGTEGNRDPALARARGPPDAVDVLFGTLGSS